MRAITLIKTMALTAFLAGTSAAGVKYVAVVETDVDAQSGASAILNPAEVRQITAELRRVAVENLPRDKYNIMTSETVQSMGGAVLEECADENCVITLGSKIGADYIVRGIISKLGARLTLSVEMYETENGTLVASLDPVRSQGIEELVERMAVACGEMYRKFAGTPSLSTPTAQIKTETNVVARKPESVTPKKRNLDYYFAPKYQFSVLMPVSWGGVNVEGGLIWGKGAFLGADFSFGMSGIEDDLTLPYSENSGPMDGGYAIDDNFLAGIGISFGNVYNLENKIQLVYGVSAGFWLSKGAEEYKGGIIYLSEDFLAPFVKLRRNFVELTYRGLLGYKIMGYLDSYDVVSQQNRFFTASRVKTGFGWNNHQLMLGLYFATHKRSI